MANFLNSPITGDLCDVPGIGQAAAMKLATNKIQPITNFYMLSGQFLLLRGPDGETHNGRAVTVDCREQCDRFWHFLKDVGISSHRSAIVKAVAEKNAQVYPGIYDPTMFEE